MRQTGDSYSPGPGERAVFHDGVQTVQVVEAGQTGAAPGRQVAAGPIADVDAVTRHLRPLDAQAQARERIEAARLRQMTDEQLAALQRLLVAELARRGAIR